MHSGPVAFPRVQGRDSSWRGRLVFWGGRSFADYLAAGDSLTLKSWHASP